MPYDRKEPARRREGLREQLWPGSGISIWHRLSNDGYATIPRLLPLVTHLIKHLATKGDPSSVYWELWARSHDEGIVSIINEKECAFASGYTGTRCVRTWREHIFQLIEMGFLRAERDGNQEYAHILIVNPLLVCAQLHSQGKTPPGWWTAFQRRAGEIGAVIPDPNAAAPNPNVVLDDSDSDDPF
jgi:hypothetical protein